MTPADTIISEFVAGPWGEQLSTSEGSKDLCKRASVALLARLDAAGVDAELHNLSDNPSRPNSQHFVLKIGNEAVDVTARKPAWPHSILTLS